MNELITLDNKSMLQVYTEGDVEQLLNDIRQKVFDQLPEDPDMSDKNTRDLYRTTAAQIPKAKNYFDGFGKDLVSDWKEKAKKVDAVRKFFRDGMDSLKVEARKPLTDWEEEEQKRLEEEALKIEIEQAHEEALHENDLFDRQLEVERKEKELEAKRLEVERKEREEQIRKEAAANAERERKEAIERAEREKKEAAERAEREKREALERAEKEKREAVLEAERKAKEEADRKEAERLEAERAEKERAEAFRKEEERKAADVEHRKTINNESLSDIQGIIEKLVNSPEQELVAKNILVAIISGKIRHISIKY